MFYYPPHTLGGNIVSSYTDPQAVIQRDENGIDLPYIASNDITVFSILDTEQGTVSSYCFDTRQLNSDGIKFDELRLLIVFNEN